MLLTGTVFVRAGTHFDIAGTAWTTHTSPYQPRGATGVGVRLLLELLADWKSVKL